MDEATIRKKVCDQIERETVVLLEKLASISPGQSAVLFGVSIGMLSILGKARLTNQHKEVV